MPILNSTPVVLPAVEEKEFPHIWIKYIEITTPTPYSGRAVFHLCPYNAETGEILDQSNVVILDDLWSKISSIPELQNAMGAIFAVVDKIK